MPKKTSNKLKFALFVSWIVILCLIIAFINLNQEKERFQKASFDLREQLVSLNESIRLYRRSIEEEEITGKKALDYLEWQFVLRDQINIAGQKIQEEIKKIKSLKKNNDLVCLLYYSLGLSQVTVMKFDQAINSFEKAVKFNPKHAQSYYDLGLLYSIFPKDIAKAVISYRKFLELAPNASEAAEVRERLQKLEK